jgi:hypothetical protein
MNLFNFILPGPVLHQDLFNFILPGPVLHQDLFNFILPGPVSHQNFFNKVLSNLGNLYPGVITQEILVHTDLFF